MPLTEKGSEIMSNMKEQYGSEKGEQVFYASRNKGKISGVDSQDLPLQNLMDKLMQKFASKDRRTRDQANVPARPTGKENDTMGTIMSGDEDEPSGGGARAAPAIRYQGKELKELGTRISGDAKRAFFKGAFKDAARFLPIGDAFKYALDQVTEAEEAPPMRPTGDRAKQLRWAMDQVGMSIPKPEGAQRAVKAPAAGRDAGTPEGARKAALARKSGSHGFKPGPWQQGKPAMSASATRRTPLHEMKTGSQAWRKEVERQHTERRRG